MTVEISRLFGRYKLTIGMASSMHALSDQSNRWFLSGTPPTANFHDIKGMAQLLGVHLGVDEAAVSDSKQFKQLQRDMTASERFQARMEVRTAAWHSRRHRLAQQFLDRFMRQNIVSWFSLPLSELIASGGNR